MSKKKKIIVLASMVALLVLTGCLNYFLNRTDNKASAANAGAATSYADYFAASHADRDATRADTVMYYNAIIASEASSAEAKANAEAQLATLLASMETEQRLENLIKALGYDDCLVTVGTANVNVILKAGTMTEQEVTQILEIISSETGMAAANVRIKPIDA